MTMRLASRAAMFVAMMALGACYDFKVPLDAEPKERVDHALVGRWRCLQAEPNSDSRAFSVAFTQAGERSYQLQLTADGKPTQEMPAYGSVVASGRVLNVRDPEDPPAGDPWTLVRYSFLRPSVLRLEVINDKPYADAQGSPAELRSALERAGHNSDAYEDLAVCIRIPERP